MSSSSPHNPSLDALAPGGHDASLALATERAWCREALLRVSRTFALNIRVLRGRMLESVRLAYLLCRAADALEDSWPGTPEAVGERFDRFLAGVDGDRAAAESLASEAAQLRARADLAVLARLPALLGLLDALAPGDADDVRTCVRTMATGMRRYATRAAARGATVPYLDDDAELHDYCYVVAGCVGEMLSRLVTRALPHDDPATAARRLALSPIVGEALQLTNILLDWPVDVRAGRCHIPASWITRHGLSPRDLVRDLPVSRELSLRLASLAHDALDRVPDYLETIPTREHRYRLFCLLPALWARASLRQALSRPDFHCAPVRPRIGRKRILIETARGVLAHGHHGATRHVLQPQGPTRTRER